MPSPRQRRGTEAEDRAADFLRSKGYTILSRHVTSRYGEIDILVCDKETLVAVEVKYRRNDRMGRAVEGVAQSKLEKIHAALEDYCVRKKIFAEKIRVDLVAIDGSTIDHLIGLG